MKRFYDENKYIFINKIFLVIYMYAFLFKKFLLQQFNLNLLITSCSVIVAF